MAVTPRWGGLRIEPYKPDPKDADLDQIIQEGTVWERPKGTLFIDAFGNFLKEGEIGEATEDREDYYLVDPNGNPVNYRPSWADAPLKPSERFRTLGQSNGTLGESIETLEASLGTVFNPTAPSPDSMGLSMVEIAELNKEFGELPVSEFLSPLEILESYGFDGLDEELANELLTIEGTMLDFLTGATDEQGRPKLRVVLNLTSEYVDSEAKLNTLRSIQRDIEARIIDEGDYDLYMEGFLGYVLNNRAEAIGISPSGRATTRLIDVLVGEDEDDELDVILDDPEFGEEIYNRLYDLVGIYTNIPNSDEILDFAKGMSDRDLDNLRNELRKLPELPTDEDVAWYIAATLVKGERDGKFTIDELKNPPTPKNWKETPATVKQVKKTDVNLGPDVSVTDVEKAVDDFDFKKEKKVRTQKKKESAKEVTKVIWGDQGRTSTSPWDVPQPENSEGEIIMGDFTDPVEKFKALSSDQKEEHLRKMFMDGIEVELGTINEKGEDYRITGESIVSLERTNLDGNVVRVAGRFRFRVYDRDNKLVYDSEEVGRGFKTETGNYRNGGFVRELRLLENQMIMEELGTDHQAIFTDRNNNTINMNIRSLDRSLAETLNTNTFVFAKQLGIEEARVNAADKGVVVWAHKGYTPVKASPSTTQSLVTAGKLVKAWERVEELRRKGELDPNIPEHAELIIAAAVLGDRKRYLRVKGMLSGIDLEKLPQSAADIYSADENAVEQALKEAGTSFDEAPKGDDLLHAMMPESGKLRDNVLAFNMWSLGEDKRRGLDGRQRGEAIRQTPEVPELADAMATYDRNNDTQLGLPTWTIVDPNAEALIGYGEQDLSPFVVPKPKRKPQPTGSRRSVDVDKSTDFLQEELESASESKKDKKKQIIAKNIEELLEASYQPDPKKSSPLTDPTFRNNLVEILSFMTYKERIDLNNEEVLSDLIAEIVTDLNDQRKYYLDDNGNITGNKDIGTKFSWQWDGGQWSIDENNRLVLLKPTTKTMKSKKDTSLYTRKELRDMGLLEVDEVYIAVDANNNPIVSDDDLIEMVDYDLVLEEAALEVRMYQSKQDDLQDQLDSNPIEVNGFEGGVLLFANETKRAKEGKALVEEIIPLLNDILRSKNDNSDNERIAISFVPTDHRQRAVDSEGFLGYFEVERIKEGTVEVKRINIDAEYYGEWIDRLNDPDTSDDEKEEIKAWVQQSMLSTVVHEYHHALDSVPNINQEFGTTNRANQFFTSSAAIIEVLLAGEFLERDFDGRLRPTNKMREIGLLDATDIEFKADELVTHAAKIFTNENIEKAFPLQPDGTRSDPVGYTMAKLMQSVYSTDSLKIIRDDKSAELNTSSNDYWNTPQEVFARISEGVIMNQYLAKHDLIEVHPEVELDLWKKAEDALLEYPEAGMKDLIDFVFNGIPSDDPLVLQLGLGLRAFYNKRDEKLQRAPKQIQDIYHGMRISMTDSRSGWPSEHDNYFPKNFRLSEVAELTEPFLDFLEAKGVREEGYVPERIVVPEPLVSAAVERAVEVDRNAPNITTSATSTDIPTSQIGSRGGGSTPRSSKDILRSLGVFSPDSSPEKINISELEEELIIQESAVNDMGQKTVDDALELIAPEVAPSAFTHLEDGTDKVKIISTSDPEYLKKPRKDGGWGGYYDPNSETVVIATKGSGQDGVMHLNISDQLMITIVHELGHAYDYQSTGKSVIEPLGSRVQIGVPNSPATKVVTDAIADSPVFKRYLKNYMFHLENPGSYVGYLLDFFKRNSTYNSSKKTNEVLLSKELIYNHFIEKRKNQVNKFKLDLAFSKLAEEKGLPISSKTRKELIRRAWANIDRANRVTDEDEDGNEVTVLDELLINDILGLERTLADPEALKNLEESLGYKIEMPSDEEAVEYMLKRIGYVIPEEGLPITQTQLINSGVLKKEAENKTLIDNQILEVLHVMTDDEFQELLEDVPFYAQERLRFLRAYVQSSKYKDLNALEGDKNFIRRLVEMDTEVAIDYMINNMYNLRRLQLGINEADSVEVPDLVAANAKTLISESEKREYHARIREVWAFEFEGAMLLARISRLAGGDEEAKAVINAAKKKKEDLETAQLLEKIRVARPELIAAVNKYIRRAPVFSFTNIDDAFKVKNALLAVIADDGKSVDSKAVRPAKAIVKIDPNKRNDLIRNFNSVLGRMGASDETNFNKLTDSVQEIAALIPDGKLDAYIDAFENAEDILDVNGNVVSRSEIDDATYTRLQNNRTLIAVVLRRERDSRNLQEGTAVGLSNAGQMSSREIAYYEGRAQSRPSKRERPMIDFMLEDINNIINITSEELDLMEPDEIRELAEDLEIENIPKTIPLIKRRIMSTMAERFDEAKRQRAEKKNDELARAKKFTAIYSRVVRPFVEKTAERFITRKRAAKGIRSNDPIELQEALEQGDEGVEKMLRNLDKFTPFAEALGKTLHTGKLRAKISSLRSPFRVGKAPSENVGERLRNRSEIKIQELQKIIKSEGAKNTARKFLETMPDDVKEWLLKNYASLFNDEDINESDLNNLVEKFASEVHSAWAGDSQIISAQLAMAEMAGMSREEIIEKVFWMPFYKENRRLNPKEKEAVVNVLLDAYDDGKRIAIVYRDSVEGAGRVTSWGIEGRPLDDWDTIVSLAAGATYEDLDKTGGTDEDDIQALLGITAEEIFEAEDKFDYTPKESELAKAAMDAESHPEDSDLRWNSPTIGINKQSIKAIKHLLETESASIQQVLKDAGIERVTLYRGIKTDTPNTPSNVKYAPLASFALDAETAMDFADFNGFIVEVAVPVEAIVSGFPQGFGSFPENEFIIDTRKLDNAPTAVRDAEAIINRTNRETDAVRQNNNGFVTEGYRDDPANPYSAFTQSPDIFTNEYVEETLKDVIGQETGLDMDNATDEEIDEALKAQAEKIKEDLPDIEKDMNQPPGMQGEGWTTVEKISDVSVRQTSYSKTSVLEYDDTDINEPPLNTMADSDIPDVDDEITYERSDEDVTVTVAEPIESIAAFHKEEKDWSQVTAVEPSERRDIGRAYASEPDLAKEEVSGEVTEAWTALADEVEEQWELITKPESEGGLGITVEFVDEDPYGSYAEMRKDFIENKRIKVLKTEVTGGHPFFTNEQNDKFRAVHDIFGHLGTGRGFDRHGEEAAYQAHRSMFTGTAQKALATELRGQNTYLLTYGDFGPQKLFILPENMRKTLSAWLEILTKVTKPWSFLISSDKNAVRDSDADNLYDISGSHHVSCGRYMA